MKKGSSKRLITICLVILMVFSVMSAMTFTAGASLSTWTIETSNAGSNNLNSVCYGGGTYVAVGDNGVIVTSPNGETWTSRTSNTSNQLQSISTNGSGTFVAVGAGGTIVKSADYGVTWTNLASVGSSYSTARICYGNGKFLAFFDAKCYTSVTGATWTTTGATASGSICGICYGSVFMAVGADNLVISSSNDGVSWTAGSVIGYSSAVNLNAVAFNGSNYYSAVGDANRIVSVLQGSSDWYPGTGSSTNNFEGVCYGDGIFVAVGANGTNGYIASSTSSVFSWTTQVSALTGSSSQLQSVCYGNQTYVAVGYNGTIAISGGVPPTSATSAATGISSSSATFNGSVNANSFNTTVKFQYGTSTSYTATVTASQSPVTGTTSTSVSYVITGLIPNQTYHYRVMGSNVADTTYGSDAAFTTTAIVPTVSTSAATSIGSTSATFNGTVNANNASTAVTFEYGLDTSYGTTATAAQSPVTGTTATSVSKAVSGLIPNTTYHYRVKGVNTAGTTYGGDLTFTTPKSAPVVTTDSAGSVTDNSATLNGTVNASNESATVTFEYGTSLSYGTTVAATPSSLTGSTDTAVSYALSGLLPNTTYHYRVIAVNGTGTTNGSDITFKTAAIVSTVATGATDDITASSVTFNGTVNANNASTVVTFEYGIDTSYGNSATAAQSPVTGTTATAVSGTITGLIPGTIYHYRVKGVNAAGTTYGDDASFTTPKSAPIVTTDDAGSVTDNSVTLNGIVNASNESTTVTFEYGTDATSYGATVAAAQSPVSGSTDTAVSYSLTGLIPNTTYHYRVVAENGTGTTNGSDIFFTTTAIVSTVATGATSDNTASSVTLNGTVNANNADTVVTFEYGTDTSYGKSVTAAQSPVTGTTDTAVSASVSGLLANTTYHYRVKGVSAAGAATGDDATFKTAAGAPTAATIAASSITSTGATINGTINDSGANTTVTFDYGTVVGYGNNVAATPGSVSAGAGSTDVSYSLTGLIPNTTYYYRVNAENSEGTTNGSGLTFKTSAVAATSATGSSSVTSTGATLGGTVNANNADTTVTFEYGLTAIYGSSVSATPSTVTGTDDTAVSAVISGLLPNTLYHYRVNGVNKAGTVNGLDATFTTDKAVPTAATSAASSVTSTGATLNGTVNASNDSTTATFEYGTSLSYGTTVTATQSPVSGSSNTAVSYSLTGLIPNTLYHYRVVAVNGTGPTNGGDVTFTTTAIAPTVTTGAVADITASGVTFNGKVNANNASTAVMFQYGLTASYTATLATAPVAIGTTDTDVSMGIITGLLPNTTYHYCLSAVNIAGTTDGSDATFTTGKAVPTATTSAATSVTSTGATLNGTVNASNESTTVTFEYGTSLSYGTTVTATQSPVSGSSNTAVSYSLTGLIPNTLYHYRVVAVNGTGPTNGSDVTFTTTAIAPTVTTGAVADITASSVTFNGKVNANNASTAVMFKYGLTASYTATLATAPVAIGTADTDVSMGIIAGLLPNTTYHYCLSAVNIAGTTDGSDATFTTGKLAPAATTNDVSDIIPTGATFSGTVNANNENTTVTFEYGTTISYGSSVSASPSLATGTSNTSVSYILSGLNPNTLYHYRVVAVNGTGTTNGDDKTFTTPLKPAVTLTADDSDNDVDHDIEIIFSTDTAFQSGITEVKFNGNVLTTSQYDISDGMITLKPSVGGNTYLRIPATGSTEIKSTGYNDSSISQSIKAGAVASLEVATQPVPGTTTGDAFATQPVITLRDQYSNICADGVSATENVMAAVSTDSALTGSWIIGGTNNPVTASAGVATFTDLRCTLVTSGNGKITFTGASVSNSSDIFTIPERNSSITPATASFDKNSSSGSYADVVVNMTLNSNTLTAVKNGSTALVLNTDYTVSGEVCIIKKEYLATLDVGTLQLTFDFSIGIDSLLTVTVSRSSSGGGGSSNVSSSNISNSNSSSDTTSTNEINAVTQNAVTSSTSTVDGKTVTTVTVDETKIDNELEQKSNNATVVVPITNTTDVAVGVLTESNNQKYGDKGSGIRD